MKKTLLGLVIFSLTTGIYAQKEDSTLIKRISDEILLNGQAYDNLHYLTKQIGGRLAGSPGMVKAEAWGAKTMAASGADKTWQQECLVPHWVRGGKDEAAAEYKGTGVSSNKKTLDIVALGNSMGTGPKGIKAEVIEVRSFDDLESKKDKLKGKIVFYNYKFNDTYISTFLAYRDAGQYRGNGAAPPNMVRSV